jgi:LysM repeat protein
VHFLVLVLALGLSGYVTVGNHLSSSLGVRLASANEGGSLTARGGQVGDVTVGRGGTVLTAPAIPTAAPVPHEPITYAVVQGDRLDGLAQRFHVSPEDIRWSNYGLLKDLNDDVKPGEQLEIPPVEGVVVTAGDGDTPAGLARAYGATVSAVMDFNYLRTGEGDPLARGTRLVIPGGRGPALVHGVVAGAVAVTVLDSTSPGNPFPFGQCTWYVWTRVHVPWMGDAWTWYPQAQLHGWRTGLTPRQGAIMVSWESRFWGHVAYVERVAPDGSWTISEMNYTGWAVRSGRTIHPGEVPLIGFIYPPGS